MASNTYFLEKFYRTQPPQQIGGPKVNSVLEYLAFSGAPIYLSIENPTRPYRITEAAVVVDVVDGKFFIDSSDLKARAQAGQFISAAFGYKRKRAFFKTQVIGIERDLVALQIPSELVLTNLRKNPRVRVEIDPQNSEMKASLKATTGVGAIETQKVQIYELSQLGVCLFVDRAEGLVLPGDRIDSLEIDLNGQKVFKTTGVVSRVDMKRQSSTLPNSYEVVVLFRGREQAPKTGAIARSAKRVPILDEKPCFFKAEHPFFPGRSLEGQVFEISTSGLSCMLQKTSFPVVPGMRFLNCSLQLPHKAPREFIFEVAHVDFRSDGNENQFKIGGEFVKAPIELIKDITAYAQETQGGLITDVSEEDLDLLWEFMFETNFIYQDKRRLLQSRSKEILQTYHRLISTDNPIVKKLVFKEDTEIKGHVSAIHFYDRAWIIQHLNALKSASAPSVAQSVIQGIVNFFYDAKALHKANVFYVMSFYRPNNLYPAILFGETAKRINDPLKSCTFDLAYGLYQKVGDRKEESEPYVDRPQDLVALSNHLIEQNMLSFVRACGLSQASELKLELSKDFASHGLMRDRHILMLEDGDEKVWGVVEMSSVGLNLSELTNSIFLFARGEKFDVISKLAGSIVERAHQFYFEPRGIEPVVLQPLEMAKALNVNWSKTYTCWITSAIGVSDFEAQSKTVVADLKDLILKFKAGLSEGEDRKAESA